MLEILFQDEFLLAINKPSGLSSLPDGYDSSLPYVRSLLEPEFGRLWIVHRLDKETSGVLLLARNEMVHRELNIQFQDRQISKTYLALACGDVPLQVECTQPLRINGDRRHRTIIDEEKGKFASTTFNLLTKFSSSFALIEADPHTGYTHQIRAHACFSGFPLLSDPLYFTGESKKTSQQFFIKRTALHAQSITFTHPTQKNLITLTAPLPDDFIITLEELQKIGASA